MRLAAFDLSSNTGIAVWDGVAGRPTLFTKKLVGWDFQPADFLELWRVYLGDFLKTYRPQAVMIESWYIPQHQSVDPVTGERSGFKIDGKTVGNQVGLSYFTQWALKASGCKVHMVTAAQWRKHAFGSSRNNGTDWKVRAKNRCQYLGWDYKTDNDAEAALILDCLATSVLGLKTPWRDDMLLQDRG